MWLAGMPFVTETHAQLFDVRWDGIDVGRVRLDWTLGGRQVLKIVRPRESAGERWARIDLIFRDLSSPAEQGSSGDTRPLGIKLGRLAFTDVDAPCPPLFEGEAIAVGGPVVAPAPDAVARLEAKCDLIAAELGATRALADEAQRSAAHVARTLDRMIGAATERGAG